MTPSPVIMGEVMTPEQVDAVVAAVQRPHDRVNVAACGMSFGPARSMSPIQAKRVASRWARTFSILTA